MKVTVITVCYNAARTIETSIQSVLSQTYNDIEYVIIDGKSIDGTLDIVNKYIDNVSIAVSEPDSGIYDAMNKGIVKSSGDYIFFLNADDRFVHERVVELVMSRVSRSRPDIVYGDLLYVNDLSGAVFLKQQNNFNKVYVYKNTPCQPSVFYYRKVFDRCGMFRTDYSIVSDFDWMLNAILRHKVSLQYVGQVITQFRTSGVSSGKYNDVHDLERSKVFAEYFPGIEGKILAFFSRYLRSVTRIPVVSFVVNKLFGFDLDNELYTSISVQ